MPVLDANELAGLRGEIRSVMNDTEPDLCTITRAGARQRNPDRPEQYIFPPEEIESDLPCRYRVSNSNDRFMAGKPADISLYTVIIPADADVKPDDILTIQEKGDDPEILLTVVTVMHQSNAFKLRVICAGK